LSVLSKIETGQIRITDVDRAVHIIGEQTGAVSEPKCLLTAHKDIFWLRLALYADMVCISDSDPRYQTDGLASSTGFCRELHALGGLDIRSRAILQGLHPQSETHVHKHSNIHTLFLCLCDPTQNQHSC
jgi:hypothetical protein